VKQIAKGKAKYTKKERKQRRRAHRKSVQGSFPGARNIVGKPLTPKKRKVAGKATYKTYFP